MHWCTSSTIHVHMHTARMIAIHETLTVDGISPPNHPKRPPDLRGSGSLEARAIAVPKFCSGSPPLPIFPPQVHPTKHNKRQQKAKVCVRNHGLDNDLAKNTDCMARCSVKRLDERESSQRAHNNQSHDQFHDLYILLYITYIIFLYIILLCLIR